MAAGEGRGTERRLDQVLYGLAEGLRVVSVLLHPFMPDAAERLLAALGREDARWSARAWARRRVARALGELGQLFPKVEPGEASAASRRPRIDRRARWSTPTAISTTASPPSAT